MYCSDGHDARAGPGRARARNLELYPGLPAGSRGPGPSSGALPGTLAGSWTGSGAVRTQTGIHKGHRHHRYCLTLLYHSSEHWRSDFFFFFFGLFSRIGEKDAFAFN